MTLAINITDDALMTALGNFLVAAFIAQVVQGQVNRVAMPTGDFIQMTPMMLSDLSMAHSSYAPGAGTQSIANPTKWTCQLDFYGPNSANNVATFKAVIRTSYAYDLFASSGLDFQPLYAGDARNTALINGEQQFENRYTLDFVAQFNPIVTVPQQFADTLDVVLKEVDAVFPP